MCSITKNSEIETAVKSRARQEENIRASTALKSPRVSTPRMYQPDADVSA